MPKFVLPILLLAAATAGAYTITVDGDASDWAGTPSLTVHGTTWSNATWIYTGVTGDQRDTPANPAQDLTLVRVTADAANLYLLVRCQEVSSATHLMLSIDTDQNPADTGMAWIGDDSIQWGSSTGLGGGALQYAERNADVHFNGSVWVCEFYADDGGSWYDLSPPGSHWNVAASEANDLIELRISFLILGIAGQSSTINLSLAVAENAAGWANDGDTTVDRWQSDGLDVMGGAPGDSTSDAWARDFEDSDVDWYYGLDLANTITLSPTPEPTLTPTAAPTATPTAVVSPSPTPEPGLMNVWHIPSNNEPPSVTMRVPAFPDEDDATIYVYVGGHPQGSIWSGTLHFRLEGAATWDTATFEFDTNYGSNEYWMASFTNPAAAGQTVEYYLELAGDPGTTSTTYVYGDEFHSLATLVQATAAADPFSFTVAAVPTPGPTATPGVTLLTVWHIPSNTEPPSVTMRNPLAPDDDDTPVYVYAGGYPQGTIWSGTLFYRLQASGPWSTAALAFDANQGTNEYWMASFPNSYAAGATVEYYLRLEGGPSAAVTYLYGDDATSNATELPAVAQAAPYTYTVAAAPTPGPCIRINCWHIPANNEPPFPDITMRRPVSPGPLTATFYFYVGAFPLYTIWDEQTDLFYRRQGETSWQMADFNFDVNAGANEYWMASFANSFAPGDTIEYYIRVASGPAYDHTFLYGDDTHSNRTCVESEAQALPYRFAIYLPGLVPAAGPVGLALLALGLGALMARRKR